MKKSQVRIVLIIAISVTVPVIAIMQRWSGIRAFARNFQPDTLTVADGLPGSSQGSRSGTAHAGGTATPTQPDWEGKMQKALATGGNPTATSRKLLEALPNLAAENKVDAVHHLANLVADDDYAPLSQMLVNPETPEAVQDLLMADVLNRRNGVKLPALLEVARTPNHAYASEAKAILQPYLRADLGDDWSKCAEKLTAWLKEHPDS